MSQANKLILLYKNNKIRLKQLKYIVCGWDEDTLSLEHLQNSINGNVVFLIKMTMVRIVSKVNGDDNYSRLRYPRGVNSYYPSINVLNKIVYEMDPGPIPESYEIILKVNFNTNGTYIWSKIVNETFCAVYDKSHNRVAIIMCGLPSKNQVGQYLKGIVIQYDLVIVECGVKESHTARFEFDHYKVLGNEWFHTLHSFNRENFEELEEFTMKLKVEIDELIGIDGTVINKKPPNAWDEYIATRIENENEKAKIRSDDVEKQNTKEMSCIKKKERETYIEDENKQNSTIRKLRKGINDTLIMSDAKNLSIKGDSEFKEWLKYYKLYKVYELMQCNGSKNIKVEITHILQELKNKYFLRCGDNQKIVRQLHDLMIAMCEKNKYDSWFIWLNVIVLIVCLMLCGLILLN